MSTVGDRRSAPSYLDDGYTLALWLLDAPTTSASPSST